MRWLLKILNECRSIAKTVQVLEIAIRRGSIVALKSTTRAEQHCYSYSLSLMPHSPHDGCGHKVSPHTDTDIQRFIYLSHSSLGIRRLLEHVSLLDDPVRRHSASLHNPTTKYRQLPFFALDEYVAAVV